MDPRQTLFLVSSILTLTAGLVIVLINPWRMTNRSHLIAAIFSALWLFSISMVIRHGFTLSAKYPAAILFWLRMSSAVAALLPWAYFLIKESCLGISSTAVVLRRSWPWAFASCLLSGLAFSESFYISDDVYTGYYERGLGYPVYLGAFLILCCLVLFDSLRALRDSKGIAQIELKFFVINLGLACLAILSMFALSSVLKVTWPRYSGSVIMVVSFSLSIWAVCYYRVFDARQVLLAIGQRVLFLGPLGACAGGLALLSEPIIQPPYGVILATVLACWLAVHLDRRAKQWLGLDPTRILQRSRQTIIDWVRRETDEEKLTAYFEQYLAQWCQAEQATLLRERNGHFAGHALALPVNWPGLDFLNKEGWITPEALLRRRESPATHTCLDFLSRHNLGTLLAVPRGSPTPSLLIGIGQKRSLRPYTYPDIQMLLDLAELIDNILTHARVAARTAQIEKMESAAMMSRGLAHDLNNLATPVSTFLLHMETRVIAGTAEAEVLADAKHSIRVMQDYIRESLFFARRLVPDFQPVSSAELLAATIRVTQARAQVRGVDVVQGKTADFTFKADRTLIQRLLQNLVFNGIDATPRGGQVTLSAATDDQDRICFSVSDQGSGVPTGIMNHIFEPYFTTKDTGNEVRGLGLGLAISKKISDLHHGTLGVGRSPSGGAIFTVSLPTNPKRPAPASLAPVPSESVLAAGPATGSLLPR